jgi:cell division protein FtsW (lipid II flippase)
LMSLGGSSLITTLVALGIVQSVVARQKAVRFGL